MGEGFGGPPPPPSSRGGLSGRWIAVIVAAVLLVIFAILNSERVRVNFLLFDTQARIVTVIVVAAALGFVIGYFVGRPSRAERKAMRD
jgi:uncharacterized integral membrane protein